jgi:putative colanic acid biosynthesis acetyltransferase WcaF
VGQACWLAEDAWIAARALLAPGAVVALGAVVSGTVPPGAIVRGNPSVVVGER